MANRSPKILTIDIETKPIEAYVWQLWDQNIAVNQIIKDWKIISVAFKWLDGDRVYQYGLNDYTEFQILKFIRKALNEADVVITQNGKKFDIKKINARFAIKKIRPASSFQQIDTRELAKKHFGFTSNSLEYMSDKLNKKYKKLKHKEFPGMELWTECLKGNERAWKCMREYNMFDVLATEELYRRLIPFGNPVNFSVYTDNGEPTCACGSTKFVKNGYYYATAGKFQRYQCSGCGAFIKAKSNLFKGKFRKI